MNAAAQAPGGEVVVYEAPDGQVRVDVRLQGDTVWLSLGQMTELFGRDKSVISRHLRTVFTSGELEREAVVAKNATTAADGKTYQVEYFNLDVIFSVGYRVNSKRHPVVRALICDPRLFSETMNSLREIFDHIIDDHAMP